MVYSFTNVDVESRITILQHYFFYYCLAFQKLFLKENNKFINMKNASLQTINLTELKFLDK